VAFRLRYQAHDLEIPEGEFVIGRTPECQLALDDPRVSRKHAVLRAVPEGVVVEDLGSRNGLSVNGAKIEGKRLCVDGDRITIGSQEMLIYKGGSGQHRQTLTVQGATHTLAEIPLDAVRAARDSALEGRALEGRALERQRAPSPGDANRNPQPSNPVAGAGGPRSHSNVRVLGAVADKALALGRIDEAEKLLGAVLNDLLMSARNGRAVDDDAFESATKAALRLAAAGAKGAWIEYVFELHGEVGRLLAASAVDELYTVVRKVKTVDRKAIRKYVESLERRSLSPAEKFLYQRIQGLENLVALK
jgi:hypothetical protein